MTNGDKKPLIRDILSQQQQFQQLAVSLLEAARSGLGQDQANVAAVQPASMSSGG